MRSHTGEDRRKQQHHDAQVPQHNRKSLVVSCHSPTNSRHHFAAAAVRFLSTSLPCSYTFGITPLSLMIFAQLQVDGEHDLNEIGCGIVAWFSNRVWFS